jgi:hypothetical protein
MSRQRFAAEQGRTPDSESRRLSDLVMALLSGDRIHTFCSKEVLYV